MKSCLKKPCFWALALIVLATGGLFVWGWYTFGRIGPICFDWGPSGKGILRVRAAQYPLPPLWSAHGQRIVFNDAARMYAVTIDPPSINSFRSPEDALGHVPQSNLPQTFEYAASLSYQGVIALTENRYSTVCGEGFRIELVNADGSSRQSLSTLDQHYSSHHPVWSRDGARIAYLSSVGIDPDAHLDIGASLHTMDKSGRDVRDYASDIEARIHPPAWSPNGKKIAFIGDEPTRNFPLAPFIAIADFNDSTVQKLAQTSSLPGWSPDSKRIAFVRHRDAVSTIYAIEADGANLHGVWSFPDTLPDLSQGRLDNYPLGGRHRLLRGHISWSKDGSEIRLHQNPFVVVNADGSNPRIMQGRPGALASWSPDESQIAVYAPDLDVRLFTMDPDGSNKRSLVRWYSAAGEFRAERVRIDIPGFDWEPYPSSEEVEQ